ncbi:hypothetical protein XA68_12590 [Ophiocordyceps unilateralis]|uniref:FAD-binding PCMH-type domain-containing protein n=1 Tax=Ophiocordyceps unilateralis TaxID=268505 RepID=A0A2A9PDI1_OPHUN|nr:hypothetical protein XA68_12590 [Ophiocordyceps unilateralis]
MKPISSFCLLSSLTTAGCSLTANCKTLPGDRDWPSTTIWESLNSTLNGRLLAPPPPAAVCHTEQPLHNASACPSLREAWTHSAWHSENPVSVMWDQFTNFSCLPEPSTPCSSRGYPAYVIDASTAEHVRVGINFAKEHNIRLIVKSSGHDFIGRSVGPGALSIWTHHLDSIEFHPDQFELDGSRRLISGNAMTLGGGVEMYNAYKAADKYNQTLVGGGGKTVACGGFISGGGHSFIAPHYGLAADNVLQMEVVTPSGHVLTVNEDRHPELFWALRGGGGSTFGVITKVTMSTHPSVKVTSVNWMIVTDPQAPYLIDVISFVVSKIPYLMDEGLYGGNYVDHSLPNPVAAPGVLREVGGIMGKNLMLAVDKPNMVEKMFEPINNTLNARWSGNVVLHLKVQEHPSFLAWFEINHDSSPVGRSRYLVSRLLDKQTLTGNEPTLRNALKTANEPNGLLAFFAVAGKGVQNAKPRGGNAVHPAWRLSYVHAVATAEFPPLNKTAEQEAIEILDRSFQPLRDLTPNSGSKNKRLTVSMSFN